MLYSYKGYIFEDIDDIKCKYCNNKFVFKNKLINNTKIIKSCSNIDCIINQKEFRKNRIKIELKGIMPDNEYQKYLEYKHEVNLSNSCLNVKFWLKRGFTEEEAKEKIKELQQQSTKKFVENYKKDPDS